MKKAISVIILFAMLLLAFCSCGGTDSVQDQGKESASGNKTSKNNLGDYNVVVESCRLAKDYFGDPIVIVKYTFTNNDDDASSFEWSLDHHAFQGGVGLNRCYTADDSANYNDDDRYKEIKKGASITFEIAYELNDTTTDVEVEVAELSYIGDKKVVKTFSID